MINSKNIIEFLDKVVELHSEVIAISDGISIAINPIPGIFLRLSEADYKQFNDNFLESQPIKVDESDEEYLLYKNIRWYRSDCGDSIKIDDDLINKSKNAVNKLLELVNSYNMTEEIFIFLGESQFRISIYNLSFEEAEKVKDVLEKETNSKVRVHQTTKDVPYKEKKITLFF